MDFLKWILMCWWVGFAVAMTLRQIRAETTSSWDRFFRDALTGIWALSALGVSMFLIKEIWEG